MKIAKYNQEERHLSSSSGQTNKLNQTNLSGQRASEVGRLSLSGMLVLGLGAMTYLTGCDVTVRQPAVVVSTPTVAVEAPAVAVEAPAVAVEAPPVVLEEGAGVVVPVGVDFVVMGGRYAWFSPELHRWYYRPAGWRPAPGYHAREVHNMRELEAIHHSEVRREVRHEETKKVQQQKQEKRQEKKKEEKK